MSPEIITKGAEAIANVDKLKDTSITVAAILVIIVVIFYAVKIYFDSIIAKKEVESVAKDNLLEARIGNIEVKVKEQNESTERHYADFYKILSEIKEKLISKDDLNNLIDVRISKHKDGCRIPKK